MLNLPTVDHDHSAQDSSYFSNLETTFSQSTVRLPKGSVDAEFARLVRHTSKCSRARERHLLNVEFYASGVAVTEPYIPIAKLCKAMLEIP